MFPKKPYMFPDQSNNGVPNYYSNVPKTKKATSGSSKNESKQSKGDDTKKRGFQPCDYCGKKRHMKDYSCPGAPKNKAKAKGKPKSKARKK